MNASSLKRTALLLSLPFTLIGASSLQAADRMQIGKWEYKITSNGKTSTATRCVSKEEAASVNGTAESARASATKNAKGCALKVYDLKGNTITVKMDCGGTIIESTGTYLGDTSDAIVKSTTDGKQSTTLVKAHRIGACG